MSPDKDQLKKITFESVSETFEAMIFSKVVATDAPVSFVHNSEILFASIKSLSPVKGKMTLRIPPDMALGITKDIYGWMEEEPPPQTMITDALAELINTIAGRIMTRLIPVEKMFELSLPITGTGKTPSALPSTEYGYKLNDQVFSLLIEGELCKG